MRQRRIFGASAGRFALVVATVVAVAATFSVAASEDVAGVGGAVKSRRPGGAHGVVERLERPEQRRIAHQSRRERRMLFGRVPVVVGLIQRLVIRRFRRRIRMDLGGRSLVLATFLFAQTGRRPNSLGFGFGAQIQRPFGCVAARILLVFHCSDAAQKVAKTNSVNVASSE